MLMLNLEIVSNWEYEIEFVREKSINSALKSHTTGTQLKKCVDFHINSTNPFINFNLDVCVDIWGFSPI